jgi:serine/threonine-protein kinase
MRYDDYRKKLENYLSGAIDDREKSLLDAHIGTCTACKMILEDVKRTYIPKSPVPIKGTIQDADVGVAIEGYTFLEKIGKGGMGEVYRAHQQSMDRYVAIKILSKKLLENESFIQRFEREARAAAKLMHPNFIRIIDYSRSAGVPYYVMEYIDGATVQDEINRTGRIPVARALEIALEVAVALGYAESEGVIHRDIKPDNIMITASGAVKVADMGLAKSIDEIESGGITMAGERLGTPYYMSPEQIKDTKSVDHRGDIYSLGATLFHMLTGRRPFTGKTPLEIMKNVLANEPEFTEEDNGILSAPVRALVLEMMEKLPKNRIQKWKAVARKIEALLKLER